MKSRSNEYDDNSRSVALVCGHGIVAEEGGVAQIRKLEAPAPEQVSDVRPTAAAATTTGITVVVAFVVRSVSASAR